MQYTEAVAASVSSGPAYNPEANSSGVSWAAVIGGGFVTAALAVVLLA